MPKICIVVMLPVNPKVKKDSLLLRSEMSLSVVS